MKKIFSYFLLMFIIGLTFLSYIFMGDIIIWFELNINSFKYNIGLVTGLLSTALYIKNRFIDTKLYSKLTKEFGKTKIYDSISIITELLKSFSFEEVIQKISLLSKVEVNMRSAIIELTKLIDNNPDNGEVPELILNRKEKRELNKQIRSLLGTLNTQLDINELNKKVQSKSRLETNLAYQKREQKVKKSFVGKLRDRGKTSIINNSKKTI